MKITVSDIVDMHPKHIRCSSDFYYMRVANELNQVICFVMNGEFVDEDILAEVALKLTLYLEDVVSEAGIWDTFVELHRRMYGRPFPFYDVPGYSASDMTEENISFLIWLFMMNVYEGQRILNPDNPKTHEMAKAVLPVLQKHRKKAPVNEDLLDLLYGDETLGDFMEIKHVLMWFFDLCYLSEWVGTMVMIDDLIGKFEERFPAMSYGACEYMVRSICAFAHKGTLLAMLPQQWYAEMLRGYNADEFAGIARDIEDIVFRNFDIYCVEGYDDVHFRLRDTEGRPLLLRKDSVESDFLSKNLDMHKVLLTAMARWKGEWQIVGMSSWLQDEGAYHDSVEEQHADENELVVLPPKSLKKLGGQRLFFFKDYAAFHLWTNKILGTEYAEKNEEHIREMKDILVFIEDSGAMSITPNGACGVKSADNPLYSPAKAPEEALRLLVSTESSTSGMSRYLAENGLLPDACLNSIVSPERGRQLVQENMDFLARCLRRCDY